MSHLRMDLACMLEPRLMNLMATSLPVFRSTASCTKPWEPLQ